MTSVSTRAPSFRPAQRRSVHSERRKPDGDRPVARNRGSHQLVAGCKHRTHRHCFSQETHIPRERDSGNVSLGLGRALWCQMSLRSQQGSHGAGLAAKAVETKPKGSVLAATAVETQGEGGALVAEAGEAQGKGGVLPCRKRFPGRNPYRRPRR